MSKLQTVRDKLDKKLFTTDVLGSNGTLYPYVEGSITFGGYSGASDTYSTGVSIVAVPYNNISKTVKFESFGDINEGEMDIVLRYDTTVKPKDKITIMSQDLYVKEVKPIPLNGGIAAILCRMRIHPI